MTTDDWKITSKIAQAEREGRIWWSFEYFPPRTAQGLSNLYDRVQRMSELGPAFVDVTMHAGGRTLDLTNDLVKIVQTYIGLETCMHLTCTNMPREKIDRALQLAKEAGCRNILALRGDPPAGQHEWEPHAAGFTYAKELVEYIKEHYGDYFSIAVAGFPEGHPEAKDGRKLELERLKEKVDAGADFVFTQMFYNFDIFADWVREVRAAGITCPIVPGVMPIQTYGGFQRATERFGTLIPQYFHDALDPIKDDDQKVREVGTQLVGDMCKKIIDPKYKLGISGLHIYTMNLERGSRMLLEYLDLAPTPQQIKTLPWTPSLTPKRRDEGIRPIFWANRARSYVSRTETWDEFPNGRWGDARSPAFGDVDAYGVKLRTSNEDAVKMWGQPQALDDVKDLFRRFCAGELKALPWSESGVAKETTVINNQLALLNSLGYLTINSQPAVDGVRSEDDVHGWGPKGGYVYQKAYLEFFISPKQLDKLISHIEVDPQITYHAVNARGDMRTNTTSDAPNAVTWGCFPHKEIVQPTIVESISFLAWKDEAYEIGRNWARVYDEGSQSRRLLERIFGEGAEDSDDDESGWFLVNVVHNDFKAPDAIFKPFLAAADPAAVSAAQARAAKTLPETTAASSLAPPLNFPKWLEENRHLLKPPVGNYCLFKSKDYTVMAVGGPNARSDYHYQPTEEFFYQVQGAMVLKVIEQGQFKDIVINEGEMFMLPPNTPHSPCRFENTVGLVVERTRPAGDEDAMRWYCPNLAAHPQGPQLIREVRFECHDLGTQLKPIIQGWVENEAGRKCSGPGGCGQVAGPRDLPGGLKSPAELLEFAHINGSASAAAGRYSTLFAAEP